MDQISLGHLKPLGYHRPPKGDIQEVLSFPDPGHFHENYVRGSTPLLFRGILGTDFLPAYKIWTDEFLRFWLEIDFFEHKSAHSFETFWRRTEWSSDGAFDRAAAEKLFAYIDLNGNQEITMDELERFDFHKAAREVPAISDFVINMVAAAVAEGIDIDFLDGPTANEHIDKVHEEL
ncbi:hypothetical protein FSP39_024754 [Pinctada imbricata]|uniref:EF-hand domain-containing protein n=1 Tax=Pinctada imbricata TaxID=66713 RepID=A0AA88YBT3_PINIB|nr:hypothetical protein FSP39_024754 [Pinctada imbricata]